MAPSIPSDCAQKHGDTEFLTELIKKEMSAADHPDALVFAGPKIMLDAAVPQDTLTPIATDVDYPVFYMNYNLNPQRRAVERIPSAAPSRFFGEPNIP